MAEDLGVVIDIGDPGVRGGSLRGLVRVRRGRSCSQCRELAGARARHKVTAGAWNAGPGWPFGGVRANLEGLLGLYRSAAKFSLPPSRIVDPGDAGYPGAELRFRDTQLDRSRSTVPAWANRGCTRDRRRPRYRTAGQPMTRWRYGIRGIRAAASPAPNGPAGRLCSRRPPQRAERMDFWPVVQAKVRVRVKVPPGPARPSRTVKASRRAASSRPGGMCRQAIAHGACDRHACHHWPALA